LEVEYAGWTKKYVVTRIYMMDDNTSQQMNAMIQTSQDRLKPSFSPLIFGGSFHCRREDRNFGLAKVQRGQIRYPGRKALSANGFYDACGGSSNVLRSLIHVKSTLISVYHLYSS
jgi:hypothetical protein